MDAREGIFCGSAAWCCSLVELDDDVVRARAPRPTWLGNTKRNAGFSGFNANEGLRTSVRDRPLSSHQVSHPSRLESGSRAQ